MARLSADVANWEHQPKFWCRRAVGWKKWWVAFGYDQRTKAGQIFGWVDEGTATYIGKDKYPIVPKTKDALHFQVPHMPKTTPGIAGIGPAMVLQHGDVSRQDVFAQKVMHLGIRPRNLSKSLKRELSERTRPGGLRSVTDAAVKRGLRRL